MRFNSVIVALLTALLIQPVLDKRFFGAAGAHAGEAISAEDATSSVVARRHVVEIKAFEFIPSRITAAAGETVVFINHDFVPHTATSVSGQWNSEALLTDQSWSIVVTVDMAGEYFCEYHPAMIGYLIVN